MSAPDKTDKEIFRELDAAVNQIINKHFDLYFDEDEADETLRRWAKHRKLSQQQEEQYEQRTDDAVERAKEGARVLRAKATELLREAESLDRWANPQEK